MPTDEWYMRQALKLAARAALKDEVPVGAAVVYHDRIVGRGFNRVEAKQSALHHAEMTALRQAAANLGRWRLTGCTLYVTLEPCAMCAGAMVLSRIDRLVYAASDPKAGACGSVSDIIREKRLNHRIRVDQEILKDEASALLKDFFRHKRKR
ncbi:MAG: tRNA adenosine(34) deaminase TadA [Candidatus Edwardsbacteria bacterium]|nr:tRNA adenosine(34) deaminase TadA [Candidatus Edwardsbacteria bacterium]